MTTTVTKNPKIPTNSRFLVVEIVVESLFFPVDELVSVGVDPPTTELLLPTVVEELVSWRE